MSGSTALVVQIYELTGIEIERRLLSNVGLDIGISYFVASPARAARLTRSASDELQLVIPADHPLREFKSLADPGR